MHSRVSSPPRLHARLYCLVLLAFLPVLVGLSIDAWQSRGHALRAAHAALNDDAILAANAQAMHIAAVSELLAMVSASYDSVVQGKGECSAYLRRILGGQAGFANAGVLDADGKLVCTAIGSARGTDYSARSYFREVRDNDRFSVSELITGSLSGQRSLVFAYPRHRADGAFAGVVFASFRDTEFAKLRLAGKKKADSHFSYFDRNGALITTDPLDSESLEPQLDADSLKRAARHPGEAVESNVETAAGVRYCGALAAIQGPSGPVAYARSTVAQDVELHGWRMGVLRRTCAALLTLLAGLALCGVFMQRWLVRDLMRMVDFTRTAISRPIGDAKIDAKTAEVHAAMGSVIEMAQRLQDQREQLALLHHESYEANVSLEQEREGLSAALVRLERLSAQLVNAQEAERKNLARELHDELGQRLTALKLMLHATLPAAAPGSDGWRQAEREVSELIAQVRAISVSLRPPALDLFPLDVAIRQMVERLFGGSGIAFAFEVVGVPEALDETLKITAYRLVQEGLTNIVRHAAATRVVVEMNGGEHGGELEIIVRDNGQGFDIAAAHAASGSLGCSGLAGMRERVELLRGSLKIESWPGQGTRIVACLPIKQVSKDEKENIAG